MVALCVAGTVAEVYKYRALFCIVDRSLKQSLVIELEGFKKPLGIHVLPDER